MELFQKSSLVYLQLRSMIEEHRFSNREKLPSEPVLCREFGVSRATVRKALEQLEKEGLITRVRGSGTYINKEVIRALPKPASKAKRRLALILQDLVQEANEALIRGVEQVAEEAGCEVNCFYTDNQFINERRCLQAIAGADYDGLIVDGVRANILNPNLDCYQKFYQRNVPVIFYDSYYPRLRYPSVCVDEKQAVELLLKQVFAADAEEILGFFVVDHVKSNEKFQALTEGLLARGLEYHDSMAHWTLSTEMTGEPYRRKMAQVLEEHEKAHILIFTNPKLYEVFRELMGEIGPRAADRYTILVFDYSGEDEHVICTLDQSEVIGRLCAEKLLEMIRKKDFKRHDYSELLAPVTRGMAASGEAESR